MEAPWYLIFSSMKVHSMRPYLGLTHDVGSLRLNSPPSCTSCQSMPRRKRGIYYQCLCNQVSSLGGRIKHPASNAHHSRVVAGIPYFSSVLCGRRTEETLPSPGSFSRGFASDVYPNMMRVVRQLDWHGRALAKAAISVLPAASVGQV
jgi:hypothetical protein